MDPKPIKSSIIASYAYDAETKELDIVFNTGVERTYKDVPPDIMSKVFDSPGSTGSKFYRLIRSKYQSQETQS